MRSYRRALGWPAVAGAVLLVAAAGVGLWPAPPPVVGPAPPPVAAVAPPPPGGERVATLLDLAQRSGISVPRAEQQPHGAPGNGTRLVMPARGAYADLRRFVEQALRHDPRLALESMRLRRASPVDAELEAELVWWLGEGAP